MRVFLLGDFSSNNGPGNANKKIKESISRKFNVSYSKASSNYSRILEMAGKIWRSDVTIICSSSRINYIAIWIAKFLRKKIIYLMHGFASYEAKINDPHISKRKLDKIIVYEKFVFSNVDRIVCVSKKFMKYLIDQMPEWEEKLDYIYNVVEMHHCIRKEKSDCKVEKKIISIGGGMKRKNILTLSKIVNEKLNNVKLIVIGEEYEDGEAIKKYDCVIWKNSLSRQELYKLMSQCDLYVQNSLFETFGLAVIEALYCGCSLLISKEVGCIDLFDSINSTDIICDNTNEGEIAEKIRYLLEHPNNDRLISGFQIDKIRVTYQAECLEKIINKTLKGAD